MCGIAGIASAQARPVSAATLNRMAMALRHRGPDGSGVWVDGPVGFAHRRLSIIDVIGGAQPLSNEDGRVVITFNGEVYNYCELRDELLGRGHRFRTRTDTEVIVHGYEEWGDAVVSRLNGQFAFALYDARRQRVLLARDRFGVRPLYYAVRDRTLYFASEVKALFASGGIPASVDLAGLDEVFTFWAARPPRTVFAGVSQLEPGTMAEWRDGALHVSRYYSLDYPSAGEEASDALDRLDDLLRSGVALRLRSDVPVGGYLSGGLDSSITCSLANDAGALPLRTFSLTFEDPAFDESVHQLAVAAQVRSQHATVHIGAADVARVFPDVIAHTETPIVRTAPAPMYLLAQLARRHDIKVVLTGEGADELFLGYDLFKETAVRRFCLRNPDSAMRARLFDRLYPYLRPARGGELWRQSFLAGSCVDDPLFSHLPRYLLTSRIKAFYSPEARAALEGVDVMRELRDALPESFYRWSPEHRAAYLEMTTLLSPYLLSSQGDRMAMAHGLEGRFPFLDHRLFEFAAALPVGSKLRGLREKEILKRWSRGIVPATVRERHKQPYRAPDAPAFSGAGRPPWVDEILSEDAVRRTGIFDPRAVGALVNRARAGRVVGVGENQAFVAVLSTQLWFEHFLSGGKAA